MAFTSLREGPPGWWHRATHCDPSPARWHRLVARQSNSIREGLPVWRHWATHCDPSPARWHLMVARQTN
jgi:hypothetical protein